MVQGLGFGHLSVNNDGQKLSTACRLTCFEFLLGLFRKCVYVGGDKWLKINSIHYYTGNKVTL